MSSGHRCLIRDLGLVKGGKGLRHHEVVLEVSWRGLVAFTASKLRGGESKPDRAHQPDASLIYRDGAFEMSPLRHPSP